MALASWALISLDEAKEVVDTASPSDDLFLEDVINAATLFCEDETNRKLASRTYTNEVYNGPGNCILRLRQYPVSSVSAVSFLSGLDTWTAQSVVTYPITIIDPHSDMIMYRNNGFPRGVQNVRVTYVAGYTSIPADLKVACRQATLSIWKQKDRQLAGVVSQSFAGQTTTYDRAAFPEQTLRLLDPYRRWAA